MMGNNKNKTILVVDDDEATLFLLSGILGKYDVKSAENGQKALELAESKDNKPDLILLDILMSPGMNGLKVCEKLKNNPITRKIPVIFLTIYDRLDFELLGFSIGAVDYVKKPIVADRIIARVEKHLEMKTKRDKLEQEVGELSKEINTLKNEMITIQKKSFSKLQAIENILLKKTPHHLK